MKVLGIMSGTSLDGLDLALVELSKSQALSFEVLAAHTITYSNGWKKTLTNAPNLPGKELIRLDMEFGRFIGQEVNKFMDMIGMKADLISSHGHTIFHEPANGYTFQIGNGQYILAETNIDVVYDFRTQDLAQGGQGAPLVPTGDALLFKDYDHCLNLGGIANISDEMEGIRMGFDISPFNILLNHYSRQLGHEFDDNGRHARAGKVNFKLLNELGQMPYYQLVAPKSLDKEAIIRAYIPVINSYETSPENVLATLVEHYGYEISKFLTGLNVLVTGGGAYNSYFLERLSSLTNCELIIPDRTLIEFKEAIIFALLGYLRIHGDINILSDVTGGRTDISSGIYLQS